MVALTGHDPRLLLMLRVGRLARPTVPRPCAGRWVESARTPAYAQIGERVCEIGELKAQLCQVGTVGLSAPSDDAHKGAALRRVGAEGAARPARSAAYFGAAPLDQLRLYSATHLLAVCEIADGAHGDLSAVGRVAST